MNGYRWEELRVGLSAAFEAAVTPSMIDQFCALSGDDNPLHADAAYARARGFEDRVAHGLLTSAFYSRLVGVHLPGQRALLHELKVTFHRPVYAGMQLQVEGSIRHLNEAYRQMEIDATLRCGEALLSKAKIRAGLLE
jgi:acyl dehydratase